ncbi:hypothetical protein Tco_0206684 [Tanacetum coccineum]
MWRSRDGSFGIAEPINPPGPEGFTFGFYLPISEIIENEVYDDVKINMSKSKILGVNVDSDKVKGALIEALISYSQNSIYVILIESGRSNASVSCLE